MPQMAVTQSCPVCIARGDQRNAELCPRDEGCGEEGGAGYRAGAAVGAGREGGGEAEPGQGGSHRDPPLPHQVEHRGPVGEVQAATDLVQHLDTVQHVTVQYRRYIT